MKILEQIAVLLMAMLVGCAGHSALQWRKPTPYVESCGILICEHRGPGKVDLEKDCACSYSNSLPDIL